MKVQCDVCRQAEATILCCADEAALCAHCDKEVHAANKLAGKHQRVPLLHPSPTNIPICDICQEKAGYFFCLEDRAILCRQCDVGVHTATTHASAHQRFLVTGVRIAPQHATVDNTASSSSSRNNSSNQPSSTVVPSEASPEAIIWPLGAGCDEELGGTRPQWEWNEIIDGSGLDQCYGFSNFDTSNVD